MTTRKMLAPQGWEDIRAFYCRAADHPAAFSSDTLVEVTDISDRPDFSIGERVRMIDTGEEYEVDAVFRDSKGRWCIAFFDECNDYSGEYALHFEKVPRQKTVLLRVTGDDEQDVEWYARNAAEGYGIRAPDGVRVERVEDPDAKGGER